MRRALALLLLLAPLAHATSNAVCSASPPAGQAVLSCGSAGLTSPVTGAFDLSGAWSWPSAGAADAVALGETAGCVTLEGATADGFEMRVCGGDSAADGTVHIRKTTDSIAFRADAAANFDFEPANGYFAVRIDGASGTPMMKLRNTLPLAWASGTPSAASDACLIRNSLGGGVIVTSGASCSAIGFVSGSQLVSPQITTFTTTGLESGGLITNTGDADGATITLLNDPTAGVWHEFAVTAAFTFTIQPSAGETLYLLDTACATISSSTVGGILHVVAATGGSGAIWVSQATGSWTCTP